MYASSKVDYSVREHLYMLPSDMTLQIRPGTVGTPVMKSHEVTQTAARPKRNSNDVLLHAPNISHKPQEPQPITHNEGKVALVLFIAGGFAVWNIFR